MAVNENDLFASACEALESAESLCAAEVAEDGMSLMGSASPAALWQWIWITLKDVGCENQDIVRKVALSAVAAIVKNPFAIAACKYGIDYVISISCPSVNTPQ